MENITPITQEERDRVIDNFHSIMETPINYREYMTTEIRQIPLYDKNLQPIVGENGQQAYEEKECEVVDMEKIGKDIYIAMKPNHYRGGFLRYTQGLEFGLSPREAYFYVLAVFDSKRLRDEEREKIKK